MGNLSRDMAYKITAVRTELSDDASHEHVDLVGYESPHTPGEPILVPISRIATQIAFGETYYADVDGERAEVAVAKCPVCGHEPGVKTSKDSSDRRALLELPRA